MKILVIEDDNFFQHFYKTKLTESGYEVELAGNGQEGLDKIVTLSPQLILLDLIMPIMDGFQFLEEIQKNETLKKIPVMVFSTLGQEKDIEKATSLGAKDYINKSYFDLPTLLSKINALISS